MFITLSCFSVPKDVRLNSIFYLIMKTKKRKELQDIAINHPAYIDYENFVRIYRECTRETRECLPASDPVRFRKNLLHSYKHDSN